MDPIAVLVRRCRRQDETGNHPRDCVDALPRTTVAISAVSCEEPECAYDIVASGGMAENPGVQSVLAQESLSASSFGVVLCCVALSSSAAAAALAASLTVCIVSCVHIEASSVLLPGLPSTPLDRGASGSKWHSSRSFGITAV